MAIISQLLKRNLSKAQLVGFILSNFIGLAIVVCGLQFYMDARTIWSSEDSFIRKDYIVVNKRVTMANTIGSSDATFTDADIKDLESQPWVRRVGKFTAADYKVSATVSTHGGAGFSSYIFFEAVPSDFLDLQDKDWTYTPGSRSVPIIISKDYLALYNFGFSSSSGLPQLSEQTISTVPLMLTIASRDGGKSENFIGRIVGFSNRINTILVPENFMKESNEIFGTGRALASSRLIVDVSSPGDAAIDRYLDAHDIELSGDKESSKAAYFLNIGAGAVMSVGAIITVLSFFILLLSISLLMQKNRSKLHSLIMLGYPLKVVAQPYIRLVAWVVGGAYLLVVSLAIILRCTYLSALKDMGAEGDGLWLSLIIGAILAVVIFIFNTISIKRKVRLSFR